MEKREGRHSRQAIGRPNARRAHEIIADALPLRDIAIMAVMGALGALVAYWLVCPDYTPITKAQHERMLAERTETGQWE